MDGNCSLKNVFAQETIGQKMNGIQSQVHGTKKKEAGMNLGTDVQRARKRYETMANSHDIVRTVEKK